ncbi:MAG: hypothetical protein ACR2KC_07025 [Acidimicrobiales bacterium]
MYNKGTGLGLGGVAGGGLAATGFPTVGLTMLALVVILAGLILLRVAAIDHGLRPARRAAYRPVHARGGAQRRTAR